MRVSRKKTMRSDRRSPLEEPASKGVRPTAQRHRKRKTGIFRTTFHRTIEKLKRLGLTEQGITGRAGFENGEIWIEAGGGSTLCRRGQARQEVAWRKERTAPRR